MEAKGTLKDVSMDWKTGRMRLTFELESDVSSLIDKMKDKPLRITVKQWREKRSLDANAYTGCFSHGWRRRQAHPSRRRII